MATLTPEQTAKLTRLAGRATLYEAVLVHQDGRVANLAYIGGATKTRLLQYVYRNAQAVAAFCGTDMIRATTTQADFAQVQAAFPTSSVRVFGVMGGWSLGFSGRTQREAITQGEHPWFGKGITFGAEGGK